MDAELRLCPFCGGVAKAYLWTDTVDWQKYYHVNCTQSDCNAKVGPYPTNAQAVAAWNRRDDRLAREVSTALDNLNWLHGAIKNTKIASGVVDALAHAREAGAL